MLNTVADLTSLLYGLVQEPPPDTWPWPMPHWYGMAQRASPLPTREGRGRDGGGEAGGCEGEKGGGKARESGDERGEREEGEGGGGKGERGEGRGRGKGVEEGKAAAREGRFF